MNTQFLTNLSLKPEQLSGMDNAIAGLNESFGNVEPLSSAQKLQGKPMGPRSEAFCRLALAVLKQNPQLLPGRMSAEEALADLEAFDQLRPRLESLTQLLARALDLQFALGNDIYMVAREVYNQLRRTGRSEGLQQACAELGQLFARSNAKTKARRPAAGGDTPLA